MERETGFEPATLCLGSRSLPNHVYPRHRLGIMSKFGPICDSSDRSMTVRTVLGASSDRSMTP